MSRDERAQFERMIENAYGFSLLEFNPAWLRDARELYPHLEAQTDAFLAANPDLSPLCVELLRATARFQSPLHAAFREVLWARYTHQRARPDLKDLVAACVHLGSRVGWMDHFEYMLNGLASMGVSGEGRMAQVLRQFIEEGVAIQDTYWMFEEEKAHDLEDSKRRRWARSALGFGKKAPAVPPPPYVTDREVLELMLRE